MSHPTQEAQWLIREHGAIKALQFAKERSEFADPRPALADAWWHAKVVYGYVQGYCDALKQSDVRSDFDRDRLEALGFSDDDIISMLHGESNDNDQ